MKVVYFGRGETGVLGYVAEDGTPMIALRPLKSDLPVGSVLTEPFDGPQEGDVVLAFESLEGVEVLGGVLGRVAEYMEIRALLDEEDTEEDEGSHYSLVIRRNSVPGPND